MLKLINVEKLRTEAEEQIKLYEEQKEVFEIIKDTFKKLEGKQVNKRIATTLQKELNKYDDKMIVSYKKDSYGWYEFYIWSNNNERKLTYDHRILLMFTEEQTNEGYINYDMFIKKFTWLDNPMKNIEEVKKDLDLINNTNIIEEYNKAIKTIEDTQNTLTALRYKLK